MTDIFDCVYLLDHYVPIIYIVDKCFNKSKIKKKKRIMNN